MQVMSELIDPEAGVWWYRVAAREFVEIHLTPSESLESKSGWLLCPGEVAMVMVRCDLNGNTFLQLSDGRGWIFERRPEDMAVLVTQIPDDPAEQTRCLKSEHEAPPLATGRCFLVVSPMPVVAVGTSMLGNVLHPGEVVFANRLCAAGGPHASWKAEVSEKDAKPLERRLWARLADGRGWTPLTDVDGKPLMQEVDPEEQLSRAMSTENSATVRKDPPPSEWMAGIC